LGAGHLDKINHQDLVVLVSASAICVMSGWAVSRLRLRHALKNQHLLRQERIGLVKLELRRWVGLQSHADGLGGQSLPQPVETRTLVWSCCGLPLWQRVASIGLPLGSEASFATLEPQEFDHHFDAAHGCKPPARRASAALSGT
jgi:hypothetical protein